MNNIKYIYIFCLIYIILRIININLYFSSENYNSEIKEYDFAIIYFGLSRSIKKTYNSHINKVYNVLKNNNLTYKKFMHTWKTNNGKSEVIDRINGGKISEYNIDLLEYKLLEPDFYKIDNENEFIDNINIDNYFYQHIWDKYGEVEHGESIKKHVTNHLCMLESQKRGLKMVQDEVGKNYKFKYVMFIRPDVTIEDDLPINDIILNINKINIPNNEHHNGLNDRFAVMNYDNSLIYGQRINELAEYRKNIGRIHPETYLKYIINKYNIPVNELIFNFTLTKP